MARGPLDDLIGTLRPIAIYGGLGWIVLHKGPDGMSVLDRITQGIGGGIGGSVGPSVPGSPQAPNPITGSSGATVSAPPNAGSNEFNINDGESSTQLRAGAQQWITHIGVGHAGAGGDFVATVEVRNSGIAFGVGAGGWATIAQGALHVGDDNDWTGYGIDLNANGFPGGVTPLTTNGWDARYTISGLSGETYTQLQQKVVGSL